MDKLLKRIADFALGFVALLALLKFLPTEIKSIDILILSGIILFILFVILITHHISKLENKIKENDDNFKRSYDLQEVWKEIEKIKLKIEK